MKGHPCFVKPKRAVMLGYRDEMRRDKNQPIQGQSKKGLKTLTITFLLNKL